MKKILFITSLYVPHIGGVETMVIELSRIYKRLGYQVCVLTKKWPEDLPEFEIIDEIPVYRVCSAKSEEDFDNLIESIKNIENDIRSDVIHVVGVRRPLPLIGLMLAKKWQSPVVMTVSGGDIYDPFDEEPGIVWNQGQGIIPESLLQADCVNAVSNYSALQMSNLMPSLKKVGTLYAGINISEINNIMPVENNKKYIFSFRRLIPSKGVDILIRSFKLIKDIFPDLNLIIAGDGGEKKNLELLTTSLGLEDRVEFIGTISLKQGISFLKSAEFTVVPSISEGGGLVNVEAQAAGCPVIASRVGGIPEYVSDGFSGILFDSGDVKGLASCMKKLLQSSDLRKSLVSGGLVYSRKFDWENLVPQYIDLYKKLVLNNSKGEFTPWSKLTSNLWIKLIS